MKFGKLKVIDITRESNNQRFCVCECDCENHTVINTYPSLLVNGTKTHCGCERKYVLRKDKEFPSEYIGRKKKCVHCNKEKDYYDFNFTLKTNVNGESYYYFDTWCVDCCVKRIQKKRKENPQQIKEYNHNRYMRKRDKYLPLYAIYRDINKEKYQEWTREWRKNNPDKCKFYATKHRNHDISSKEQKALLDVFNHECAYCGMTETDHKNNIGERLHNEHVDDQGYNDLRNCVPSCKSCNCSKANENVEEWYKKQEFFDEIKFNKIIWWCIEGYKNYIEAKPPYKITRSRINNDDGTYNYQYELWTINEYRDMIECIDTKRQKKDLELNLINMK